MKYSSSETVNILKKMKVYFRVVYLYVQNVFTHNWQLTGNAWGENLSEKVEKPKGIQISIYTPVTNV